jgi:hypothetical protein
MKLRILLCAFLAGWPATLATTGSERLTLQVSPSIAFAPADLMIRAIVEADSRNRAIEITAESDDFYRSSEVPLDGANAPRTTQFRFRSLPGGAYMVSVVLKDANAEPLALARRQIRVVSSYGR